MKRFFERGNLLLKWAFVMTPVLPVVFPRPLSPTLEKGKEVA
ncbi:MAG: hypothetical protein ACWGSQ_05590 [Longimicrobiales bacterium]